MNTKLIVIKKIHICIFSYKTNNFYTILITQFNDVLKNICTSKSQKKSQGCV